MRIVIHHPYFLPWLGYFSKLEFADAFVVLNNVGFRRDHIKRVHLFNSHNDVSWFCVPVGNNWGVPCDQIRLPSDPKYIEKMIRFLYYAYKHAGEFEREFPVFESLFRSVFRTNDYLIHADLDLVRGIRSHLGLKEQPIYLSSEVSTEKRRTERLLEICYNLGASELLIGSGHMEEVHDLDLLRLNGVTVLRHDFARYHPTYLQLHSRRAGRAFVPGLSVVDALLNVGAQYVAEMVTDSLFNPIVEEYV